MTEVGSSTDAAKFKSKPTLSPIIALPYSEANRPGPSPEPISFSPIGERFHLPSGAIVERPNPLIITHLQAADSRVHYYATDQTTFMMDVDAMRLHHRAVSRKIEYRVREDFPDEDIFVRGTVGTLIDPTTFLYWNRDWAVGSNPTLPLNSISEILANGTDDGGNHVGVGHIEDSGKMNDYSIDWLSIHYGNVAQKHNKEDITQVFPILLVYRQDAFVDSPGLGYYELTGNPTERIAALYITDRVIVPDELNH
jgi:hypothetical protein